MIKLKAWISAARLRTLPLSISGIIVGASLFNENYLNSISYTGATIENEIPHFFTTVIFWLAIGTTLGLQILSNFANDYGDGVKGTDNEDRVGPLRAIQSGILSTAEMKIGIICTSLITLALALLLIYTAFGKENFLYSIIFFLLGLLAITAAIKYTVGNVAYGYRGLGDVFVFIFFGLVSVVGTFFLFSKAISIEVFLPAIAIGLLSTAVLNLNNMRDYFGDKKAGKNTFVVKVGLSNAKKYHYLLILVALLSLTLHFFLTITNSREALFFLAFIPLLVHIFKVYKIENTMILDPELKKVALSTFFVAILFSLGQIL
ncbi:1,4-dihydroxy-2-naphthoate octaprenyltransferase [Aquimarina sp. W85]|uniref:1,4-dihydroxy-2-naphthoate octaprenyltransferase n=1 Tax=Aquimarina rhodophyticola TaxID=3342246 RepID=UPI00366D49D5